MHKKISSLVFAVALLSLGLVSCQPSEDRVAQAEEKLKEAHTARTAVDQNNKESETDKQIREYVENTPDLYRISWKVCGDYNAPYNNGTRCNETRSPRTKGYFEPAYMWAANKAQFVNKQHFAANFHNTGLFVKSRGCLKSGKPKEEEFYHVRDFMLEKGKATPSPTDVKIEVLSKQEKQQIVQQAFNDAETEISALNNYGVSATTGLIPTGKSCLTVEEWKTTQ
ncbi:hypothetical protein A6770_32800 [Nostoc minutum NIES-26]|uniref:Lipoprotein n=1 Tax=Nostoc minutum NIES-26 TaxID=1844469 RepID=A0A367Q380_9NOSO|nr:hypothetical protein A6770_32800 [Nostoc minutum NIES-26]